MGDVQAVEHPETVNQVVLEFVWVLLVELSRECPIEVIVDGLAFFEVELDGVLVEDEVVGNGGVDIGTDLVHCAELADGDLTERV